jgi:2-polyprenyl-3-methyl-5-hydroxy-6-metoxy-1,4-benzoquinol methylase
MASEIDLLARGHYARKQIFSRNRLVAWSHSSRFALARRLVAPYAGGRLLDYGCGDGTFLALLHDLFPDATGADVEPSQIAECAQRLGSLQALRFSTTDSLVGATHTAQYDVVTCMEVLEHCPEDIREGVLDDLRRLCAPRGVVIISVPIETGPSLAAKQAARAFAAFTGLREYAGRERYSPREFLTMLFAGSETSISREERTATLPDGRAIRFTGHKGFNWRALERSLDGYFVIDRRLYSPMRFAGRWLNSQVWFICRLK